MKKKRKLFKTMFGNKLAKPKIWQGNYLLGLTVPGNQFYYIDVSRLTKAELEELSETVEREAVRPKAKIRKRKEKDG